MTIKRMPVFVAALVAAASFANAAMASDEGLISGSSCAVRAGSAKYTSDGWATNETSNNLYLDCPLLRTSVDTNDVTATVWVINTDATKDGFVCTFVTDNTNSNGFHQVSRHTTATSTSSQQLFWDDLYTEDLMPMHIRCLLPPQSAQLGPSALTKIYWEEW